MTSARPQVGYIELLRELADYRKLYAAHTLSLLGDWFNTIAVLLVLTRITHSSARSISFVLILKLLPVFLMGPVAGVVVDRFSRKTIMVVADLTRAGVVLAVLLVQIWPEPWIIYAATGVQIGISAFFEPARTASVPNLVPERALTTSNALGAVTWSAMFTLGAAVGGVVTEYLGWQTAVLLDSATYLISAVLIGRIALPHRLRRPKEGHLSLYEMCGALDVVEGFRYIRSRGDVVRLILVKPIWGLAGAITLVLTVMGDTEYAVVGSTALGISALYTARAVGTGLGPIVARWLTRSEPGAMWRILGWAYPWGALWYLLFAASDPLLLAASAVTIAHLGGSTLWVFSTVLLQRTVPDEFRGRVFSAELGLFTLVASASFWVYGWLMDVQGVSPRASVVIMAVTMIPPAVAWILARPRDMEDASDPSNGEYGA